MPHTRQRWHGDKYITQKSVITSQTSSFYTVIIYCFSSRSVNVGKQYLPNRIFRVLLRVDFPVVEKFDYIVYYIINSLTYYFPQLDFKLCNCQEKITYNTNAITERGGMSTFMISKIDLIRLFNQ